MFCLLFSFFDREVEFDWDYQIDVHLYEEI